MGEQIPKAGGPTVVVENRPGGGMTIGTEAAAARRAGRQHRAAGRQRLRRSTWRLEARQLHARATSSRSAISPRRRCRSWCRPRRRGRRCRSWSPTPRPIPARSPSPAAGPRPRCMSPSRCSASPPRSTSTTCPMAAAAPPINALMGGHVQAVWADYPTVVSQLKSGTLRALVTTSPKRTRRAARRADHGTRPASPNTRPRFSTGSSRRRRRRPRRSRSCPTCWSPR